jgi:NAD(P)-dependent dehydrogenase (short-subunit alcohol dehydrogenase family)/acyl carrier protein
MNTTVSDNYRGQVSYKADVDRIHGNVDQAFVDTVRTIFSEVTRYPLDILDPLANLEDDLGIDSVKRGEIFSVLQVRFNLPENMNIPVDSIRTIMDITQAISHYVDAKGAVTEMSPSRMVADAQLAQIDSVKPADPGPGASAFGSNVTVTGADMVESVRGVIAEVTRYPIDILQPDAQLEDDLGIDSVKRAEILVALQQRFKLPDITDFPTESLRTVSDISNAIGRIITQVGMSGVMRESAGLTAPASHGTFSEPQPEMPPAGNIGHIGGITHSYHENSFLANSKPFAGKVSLVTGSGHGIGRAIAKRLGQLGATVIVNSFHSRNQGDETVREICESGGDAVHMWGSVANSNHLSRLFKDIESQFGCLDFFISNASNGIICPLSDLTEEQLMRAFQTNVAGLHQAAMKALPLMQRRGGGKILTLSSPGAHRHIEHFGCMGPVKAAVESMSLYLAVELGRYNVQVNCISAGPIYGDLLSKYPDGDRLIPYWESLSAGNQLGTEDDVADFAMFLLSSASRKITGSVQLLDAGGSNRI